jgi:hypothetical protein
MYDEDDDENDDEDDEDCHEFDDMMRLKKYWLQSYVVHDGHGRNDHDYDIALDWLIDNGHYTPENS